MNSTLKVQKSEATLIETINQETCGGEGQADAAQTAQAADKTLQLARNWPASVHATGHVQRNKQVSTRFDTPKGEDMDERVTAHIVGLSITVVYFLCIALAAAAMM